MTEVGIRVATVRGAIYPDGSPAPENIPGMVIGHVRDYDIVSVDGDGAVILVKEGMARVIRQPNQRPSRSRPRR